MPFTDRAKLIALGIVHVFETSKPFGDYSAVAVLDDGAGISYGTSQFTHKSGSLGAVLRRFEKLGGQFPPTVADWYDEFITKTEITAASKNTTLKGELKTLGRDPIMRRAQDEIAFENYLKPAIDACEGSDFVLPLSLAVVYDSHNQGSYARVRDRVKFQGPANGSIKPVEFEKEWITEYCQRRVTYLSGLRSSAARASVYRPKFFLEEIRRGNWNLDLPLNVHGVKLTEQVFRSSAVAAPMSGSESNTTNGTAIDPAASSQTPSGVQAGPDDVTQQPPAPTSTEETHAASSSGEQIVSTTNITAPSVAVEKEPEPPGFFEGIKLKIVGWWTTIGGAEGARQYSGDAQAFGITGNELFQKIIVVLIVAFVLWILYHAIAHLWRIVARRWLTTSLVKANSTPGTVIVAESDKLDELEKAGWVVVRRQ